MRSWTTGSSRRTRPARSPIPSCSRSTSRSARHAPSLRTSNGRMGRPLAQHRGGPPHDARLQDRLRQIGTQLRAALERGRSSTRNARTTSVRVEIRDLVEQTVVKPATERKHLTDCIKMIAYQAESDLVNLVQPHYPRAEQEGRTLLHELFAVLPVTSKSPRPSCRSPSPRSAPRTGPVLYRPSAICSTRPPPCSRERRYVSASPCARLRASVSLSRARQLIAPQLQPRHRPAERQKPDLW